AVSCAAKSPRSSWSRRSSLRARLGQGAEARAWGLTMRFPPTDRGGATRRDGASDTRTVGGVGPGRRGMRPSRRQGERPPSGVYVHRRPERPPMKADRQARRGSACSSSAAGASGTRSGRRSPSTTRWSTNYTLLRRDVEEGTKVERGGVRGGGG